jgi:hypothetical protein
MFFAVQEAAKGIARSGFFLPLISRCLLCLQDLEWGDAPAERTLDIDVVPRISGAKSVIATCVTSGTESGAEALSRHRDGRLSSRVCSGRSHHFDADEPFCKSVSL